MNPLFCSALIIKLTDENKNVHQILETYVNNIIYKQFDKIDFEIIERMIIFMQHYLSNRNLQWTWDQMNLNI